MARVPAGAASSRSRRLAANTRDRLLLGRLPQPHPQVHAEADQDPGPPGPADGVGQPAVGRPAAVGDAEALGDPPLVVAVAAGAGAPARRGLGAPGIQVEVEHLLLLAAEQRQDAVRGQPGERLGEIEVVGELGARLLLALAHPGDQPAARPHPLAQHADQVRVLGEPLDQDRPRAVQRRRGVGHALVRVDVGRGRLLRVASGVGQQRSASGSSPASRAICALVRRFGLNGR